MRVAAIFGLGSSQKTLEPFQQNSDTEWIIGLPSASDDAEAILVFGGDGTIHRHLAQLVKLQRPVLVVPCGSGNDFARALNLRNMKDSVSAWRKFSSGGGNLRTIDLGVMTPQRLKPHFHASLIGRDEAVPSQIALGACEPPKAAGEAPAPREPAQYFCCVAGLGLDTEVARLANRLPRWMRARGGYVMSLAPALMRFVAIPMRVLTREPSGEWALRSDKPTTLAALANTPAYGGGMKIAPAAKLDDGLLDVCLVTDIDRFKLACLFPTVYFGRHLGLRGVTYFRVDVVRVESEYPLDVYADGEYVCQTPVEIAVAPNALKVITA